MHKETESALERGPHPLPWTLIFLLLFGAGLLLHSVVLGTVAGLTVGLYLGHYHGSIKVLQVWRRDLELDVESLKESEVVQR